MKHQIMMIILIGILFQTLGLTTDSGFRDWLKKLNIKIPNVSSDGFEINDLIIDSINLGGIQTSWIITQDDKTGLSISCSNVGMHANGGFKYSKLSVDGILDMKVKNVSVTFPLNLTKDKESGLVLNVSTSGFSMKFDKDQLDITFSGSTLPDAIIQLLIQIVKNFLLDQISKILCSTASKELDMKLTELFAEINKLITSGAHPIQLNTTIKHPVDLSKVSILDTGRFLLNKFTGVDGPLNLNKLVNLTSNNTGELRIKDFYTKPINFDFNVTDGNGSYIATIGAGLLDLNVSDLNTWGNFSALVPNDTDPIALDTYTYLNSLGINLTFFVNISCTNGSIIQDEVNLYEKAELVAHLVNNSLWAQLQLPTYPNKLVTYSNKQCFNLKCILDLFDGRATGLNSLALGMSFNYIALKAGTGELEDDIQKLFNDLVGLFVDNYKEEIPLFVDAILNSTGINLINKMLGDYLMENECEDIKDEEILDINYTITFTAISGAFILYALFFWLPLFNGKKQKGIKLNEPEIKKDEMNQSYISLSDEPRKQYLYTCTCAGSGKLKWLKEFARTDPEGASLFLNPKISLFWRFTIPLLILFTIAIFISSNTGTGASVYILFSIAVRKVQIPSLFDFGLGNSVRDMWKAGVYPLSMLICFFSGIWPYLKLILMLITWVVPTSLLSKSKRESALMFLDATGKWSLLDSYVMILMLVAFHFDVPFPIVGEKIIDQTRVEVLVNAAYGFLTLLTCTCASLALSHIIIYLHRSLDASPDENKGEEAESRKSLISYAEKKTNCGKRIFQVFITLLLFSTLGLVIYGEVIISFSFDFKGLAAYALDLLDIVPHREYSVIDLGLEVPGAAEFPNSFTIRFTQIIYFLTTCAMPIFHLLVVIALWLFPLKREIQKPLYLICEILNAWSCLDVFVISIIAAVVEIGQFADFIVGDKCDFINPFIVKYFHDLLDGYDICFRVEAFLQSGCWILFGAAIMYFIGSMIVMKACRDALIQRIPKHIRESRYAINDNRFSDAESLNRSSKQGLTENSEIENSGI